ncbi:cucumber peeling cupredoxin-like [Euphorbia lathyris]|uniref:cucumber peeling cupredoxin-like n=1 Tax=Euphorbia lathyris TaxID=212925 RepID=UPI00331322F1
MDKHLIRFMILTITLTLTLLEVGNGATTFTVGDSLGWSLPPNNSIDFYQNWSANHTFQIGDSLLFNWTGTHTATEVANKEEYENCTKMGIILASSGISTLLSQNGTRYFVCSVGTHCEQGMKVAVKVGNGIPPPLSAAPSLPAASFLAAILYSIAILFFTHV